MKVKKRDVEQYIINSYNIETPDFWKKIESVDVKELPTSHINKKRSISLYRISPVVACLCLVVTTLIMGRNKLFQLTDSANIHNSSTSVGIIDKENKSTENSKQLKDIPVMQDMRFYDYQELKDESTVIALVEVLDELQEEKSHFIRDEDFNVIYGFYGERTVKVLEYFKDEEQNGDTLKIIEAAAIDKGTYIHSENYESLKKGGKYIVFLNRECGSKNLAIISSNNGVVNMDDMNENEFVDITVKSVVDFKSDIDSKEKEKILKSKIYKSDSQLTNYAETEVEIGGKEKVIQYTEPEENKDIVYVQIDE